MTAGDHSPKFAGLGDGVLVACLFVAGRLLNYMLPLRGP